MVPSIPKKVNRHVLKALDMLQTSRTDFVHIEAIQDKVRRSLRHTKPVSDLEDVVQESLNYQTKLGILTRSGASMYAMTLKFKGLRSERNILPIKQNKARARNNKKSFAKKKPGVTKPKPITPARAMKSDEESTSNLCHEYLSLDVYQGNTPRRGLRSAPVLQMAVSSSMIMEENFHIPKKVNRHVLKAVRYFTEIENYNFAPLDMITNEVRWTMRNLIPVRNIETVIERSLSLLSNMEVLSERQKTYRLNRVESHLMAPGFSIFGKVSTSFFPSQESHVSVTQSSSSLNGESYIQTSTSDEVMVTEDPTVSVCQEFPSSTNSGNPENASLVAICGSCESSSQDMLYVFGGQNISHVSVPQAQSSTHLGAGESYFQTGHISHTDENGMQLNGPILEDSYVSQVTQSGTNFGESYIQAGPTLTSAVSTLTEDSIATFPQELQSPIYLGEENASPITLFRSGEPFLLGASESLTEEMQNAFGAQNISHILEPLMQSGRGEADNVAVAQETQSAFFFGGGENASSIAFFGNLFGEPVALASESNFPETHNIFGGQNVSYLEDSGVRLSIESSLDSPVSFSQAAQTFQDAGLQSIANGPNSLILVGGSIQAEQSSTSAERRDGVLINQGASPSEPHSLILQRAYLQAEQSLTSAEEQDAVSLNQGDAPSEEQ